MKIIKQLKNATFEYDEEAKSFTISGAHPALRRAHSTKELVEGKQNAKQR